MLNTYAVQLEFLSSDDRFAVGSYGALLALIFVIKKKVNL